MAHVTLSTLNTFLESGQAFQVIDSWTARAEAHRELREPWIGSTSFFIKHSQGTEDQFDGQMHRQPEKGYVNICLVFNDYSFIDNHRNNVDSWHVHTLSDNGVAAASAVSVSPIALEDVVASESRCGIGPRLHTFY